jgi:hypothetical protein
MLELLKSLDWEEVASFYTMRVDLHRTAIALMNENRTEEFARLALGISDPAGNFSASRHRLGRLVLARNNNAAGQVFKLARRLREEEIGWRAPEVIYAAAISYAKISVGSEIGLLVNPERMWVTNERSVWASLVVKHDGNMDLVDSEYELYVNDDPNSEMHYSNWAALHAELVGTSMVSLLEKARQSGVSLPSDGETDFLLADSIASFMYDQS